LGAGIVVIIASILVIVAVFLPFYQISGNNSTADFDFSQICATGTEESVTYSACLSYSAFIAEFSGENGSSEAVTAYTTIENYFEIAGWLAIAGGALGIIGGAFCMVASVGIPFAATRKMLTIGVPLIGGLLMLGAVIAVPVGIQIAGSQMSSGSTCTLQFFTSCNGETGNPWIAWYLFLVCFVLAIIAVVMASSGQKKSTASENAAYYQQQPSQPAGYGGYSYPGQQYPPQQPYYPQQGGSYGTYQPAQQYPPAAYSGQAPVCPRCGGPKVAGGTWCAVCGTRF
jgi:hypothetical protein